jgi:uncharacterized protein (DUF1684 family)
LHKISNALKKVAVYLILTLFSFTLHGQNDDGYQKYKDFWAETDSDFKDPEKSPLPKDQITEFDSVHRFDFNPDYRVIAEWLPVEKSKPFYFETTGKIKQKYRKVGIARFTLNGKPLELSVYKNLELSNMEGFKDYLFVPFTDDSNGIETYGGGRYISMHAEPADSIIIDFNQSYNPYCAYNDRYSCPIPPRENFLDVAIPAGAKSDH